MKPPDFEDKLVNPRMSRLWISFILALNILWITPNSYSFDVDGFQSGMTPKAVMEIINENSFFEVSREGNDIRAYDIRANRKLQSYHFSFCRSKLVLLQKNLEPSMAELIELLDIFSKNYGQYVQCETEILHESYGKHRAMHLFWKNGSEMFSIHYHVFPKNDQLFVVYEVENSCYQIPYFNWAYLASKTTPLFRALPPQSYAAPAD